MSDANQTTPAAPTAFPADESPTTDHRVYGPSSTPTHPLATAPVGSPPYSVDGFVKEFLHELNTNQGVALSRSSINDQYLALARVIEARNQVDERALARTRAADDADRLPARHE